MKTIIASDIHGSSYYCQKLMDAYEKEQAERLILLGDLLYHGPRNALPSEYDCQKVIALLNAKKDSILAVRGNCDAEIDQMVLEFPMMADYAWLQVGKRMMFITHGHLFNTEQLPPFHSGDILLNGHFHVPACREYENFIYMNPGSASIPKEDSWHGYILLEDTHFTWKDFDGTVHMEYDA